jgi:histone H3/H4
MERAALVGSGRKRRERSDATSSDGDSDTQEPKYKKRERCDTSSSSDESSSDSEDAERHNELLTLLVTRESDDDASSSSDSASDDEGDPGESEDNEGDSSDSGSEEDDGPWETSGEDSSDELEEAADEADTTVALIRESMEDLRAAQGYARRILQVYAGLGVRDPTMTTWAEAAERDTAELERMGIHMYGSDSEDDDTPDSDVPASALWKAMDEYIEGMWEFVEAHAGFPPPLDRIIPTIEAIGSLDCWRENAECSCDDWTCHVCASSSFDDFRVGALTDELLPLVDEIRERYGTNTEFITEFKAHDAPGTADDVKTSAIQGSAQLVEHYATIQADCDATIIKFAVAYPVLWGDITPKDSYIDDHRALAAVRDDQQRTTLAIPRNRMRGAIEGVLHDVTTSAARIRFLGRLVINSAMAEITTIDDEAVDLLHAVAEDYITQYFRAGGALAAHAGRDYLLPQDLRAARRSADM